MERTEELVTNLLNLLKEERPLLSDALMYLTKTQQHEYKYIGGVDVKGSLNGLHGFMKNTESFTVKEKVSTNQVMKDMTIILKLNHSGELSLGVKSKEITCRLIKESDVRKPNVDGVWGINISSFKFVD